MLAAVTVLVFGLMLIEARRASANERAQRTRGGIEPPGDPYNVLRVAYPAAFLAMIAEGVARGTPPRGILLAGVALFAAAKVLKWWAILALGPFWTFRVLVVPGASLVATGPYRYVRHPNYVAVVGELVAVALMTGARLAGPIVTLGFGLIVLQRIAVEEKALMPPSVSERSTVPRWARAVDILCLLLVALAVIVAMSSGFRQRVGPWRIAVTSPYPLLIWAFVLGVVRHLAEPRTPVYRDLPRRLAAWWRVPGVRSAATVLVGTRPAIFFVGYLAVFVFGYAGGRAPYRLSDNELVNLPVRWDTGWYLQIATDGYSFTPNEPELQQNIVFFPAYPLVVRVAGRLFGGRIGSYTLAGVFVALAAFLGALIYLYALARDTLGDDEARYALWLTAAYPFALFFGAIYTESLFLLGATGAFYHFTKRQFGRAALWGLLVGLTRPNGFLLSAALGVLAVSPWLPPILVRPTDRADPPPRRDALFQALAAAAMPGAGMLLYSAFLWRLTGDPFAWAAGHAAWGRKYQGLAALVGDRYDIISHAGLQGYVASLPHDVLNALGVIFVLATVWPVARRLGLAYAVFILINILPPLTAGGLISAGRLSSVLFPAFIWLAGAVPPRHRAGWIATFASIQAFNAALFYTWRPLY